MFKRAVLLVLAVAFSLAFGVGCGASSTGEKSSVRGLAAPSSIAVGHTVGDRIIPFTLQLVKGGIVTSDDLLKQNRPTFMLFFKPNWSVCFAELRRIKEFYPDYADRVAMFAVSYDPSVTLEEIEQEMQMANWSWPAAAGVGTMARDYRVMISSIKVAFDSRGVIIYRAGFGEGSDDDFRQVFQNLAASR